MRRARLRNTRGQEMGAKGLKMRRQILDVTRDLLHTKSVRDITAVEVGRLIESSSTTFYIYFDDVPAAVLVLLVELSDSSPDFSSYFSRPWAGETGAADARALVAKYVDFFVSNYALIKVRNILADEGDARFAEIRAQQTAAIVKGISLQIATHGAPEKPVSEAVLREAFLSAGLLMGMIDRLCTICTMLDQHPYKTRGLTRARLVRAGARILLEMSTTAQAAEELASLAAPAERDHRFDR